MENLHLSTTEENILFEMFTLTQMTREGYTLTNIKDYMNSDDIGDRSDGFLQISLRETAFALGKLEQAGLINSQEHGDDRLVVYQITKAGREYALFANEIALVGSKNFETGVVIDDREAVPSSKSATEDAWEPLPLDRQNPALAQAIEKIDELIQAVEQDNGYAANEPDERNFILSALRIGVQALKDQTVIYGMQFQAFIWEPIKKIATRFAPGAIGVLADAAKEGLKEAFKHVAKKILDNW